MMSANRIDFKQRLQELKSHVGVTDVALKLGYRVDRRAGVGRYVEMVLGTQDGETDRIIVSHPNDRARQTYFRRDQSRGDVVTLIRENLSSFYVSGKSDWQKIARIMSDMAGKPMPSYEDSKVITASRTAQVFDAGRYDVVSFRNGEEIPRLLQQRGFTRDTFSAFSQFIIKIRDRRNSAFDGYNLGFKYCQPGSSEPQGYEIRGAKGFKSKAAGTNSSSAAWIADLSIGSPHSVKEVFFMESAFDAMAFYQANRHAVDWNAAVLVSVGGGNSGESMRNILSHYAKAAAIDCFDNDMAGRGYGKRLFEVAEKLCADFPEQSHMQKQRIAPDGYKDWNDVIMGKPQQVSNVPSKYDRDENLQARRMGGVKL